MPSSPWEVRIDFTRLRKESVLSMRALALRKPSAAVLNSCALCRISLVCGSQNRACSSRASRMEP